MNVKNCLATFLIIIAFFCVGVQATIVLQTNMPKTFDNTITLEIHSGNIITPNGGGDPVPGPGIPR